METTKTKVIILQETFDLIAQRKPELAQWLYQNYTLKEIEETKVKYLLTLN